MAGDFGTVQTARGGWVAVGGVAGWVGFWRGEGGLLDAGVVYGEASRRMPAEA